MLSRKDRKLETAFAEAREHWIVLDLWKVLFSNEI